MELGPALLFTAYNRLNYFRQALASWYEVRDLKDWHVCFSIDGSPDQQEMVRAAQDFISENELTDAEIIVRTPRLGVLSHPWVAFEQLFARGHDFVLRTEDDLVVSTDVLRVADAMREHYAADRTVACVNLASYEDGDPREIRLRTEFNPLVWGTWKDRWESLIGPTWDHNYSTFNGKPGVEAGWDWNLNTRILPRYQMKVAAPVRSRVDNIGVWGQHSNPDTFFHLPHFERVYKAASYTVR